MAGSTTTREHRPTAGAPARADRSAGLVPGAAVIAMGLVAGLFYAFDVAVMPGLTAAVGFSMGGGEVGRHVAEHGEDRLHRGPLHGPRRLLRRLRDDLPLGG